MIQFYGTFVCDIGPQKFYYNAHISDMLLELCNASSTEGVKGWIREQNGVISVPVMTSDKLVQDCKNDFQILEIK